MKVSLKAARVNANLTQEEAADRIGVTPLTICRWERGRHFPTLDKLPFIEKAYGIKIDDLNFMQ